MMRSSGRYCCMVIVAFFTMSIVVHVEGPAGQGFPSSGRAPLQVVNGVVLYDTDDDFPFGHVIPEISWEEIRPQWMIDRFRRNNDGQTSRPSPRPTSSQNCEATCSICFEDMLTKGLMAIHCGHVVCSACYEKLNRCPTCRASIADGKSRLIIPPKCVIR